MALLVSALNDATKYNEGFLNSETIRDLSDYEEHLFCLESFQSWLESEYKNLEPENPDLLKYDVIVGGTPSE
ncbi:MAG: hypothetical protein COB04_19270 [Gammaproteobacteria bacterium]|nr:MAG: hypothetical protein COB04_19270 [Gammaproteobacteria bacterium]